MELLIIVAAFALFAFAAERWGVDSRVFDLDPAHPAAIGLS